MSGSSRLPRTRWPCPVGRPGPERTQRWTAGGRRPRWAPASNGKAGAHSLSRGALAWEATARVPSGQPAGQLPARGRRCQGAGTLAGKLPGRRRGMRQVSRRRRRPVLMERASAAAGGDLCSTSGGRRCTAVPRLAGGTAQIAPPAARAAPAQPGGPQGIGCAANAPHVRAQASARALRRTAGSHVARAWLPRFQAGFGPPAAPGLASHLG